MFNGVAAIFIHFGCILSSWINKYTDCYRYLDTQKLAKSWESINVNTVRFEVEIFKRKNKFFINFLMCLCVRIFTILIKTRGTMKNGATASHVIEIHNNRACVYAFYPTHTY